MMAFAPIIRIILRYVIGTYFGVETADTLDGVLISDPTIMESVIAVVSSASTWIAAGAMAAVEAAYAWAKKRGGKT